MIHKENAYIIIRIPGIELTDEILDKIYFYETEIPYFGLRNRDDFLQHKTNERLSVVFTNLAVDDCIAIMDDNTNPSLQTEIHTVKLPLAEIKKYFLARELERDFLAYMNADENQIEETFKITMLYKEKELIMLNDVKFLTGFSPHILINCTKDKIEATASAIKNFDANAGDFEKKCQFLIRFANDLIGKQTAIVEKKIKNILLLSTTVLSQDILTSLTADAIKESYFSGLQGEKEVINGFFFYKKTKSRSIFLKDKFELTVNDTIFYNLLQILFLQTISTTTFVKYQPDKIVIELNDSLLGIIHLNKDRVNASFLVILTSKANDSIIFK